MPNRCAGCGHIYDNYAVELIRGCDCGSSVFIYQRVTTADARRVDRLGVAPAKPQHVSERPLLQSPGAAPGPAAFEIDPKEVTQRVQSAFTKLQQKHVPELIQTEKETVEVDDVEFDLECIKIIEDGVYDINIKKLAQKEPLIVEIKEDGKYFVHLASLFKKAMEIEDEALELKKKK